MASLLAVTLLFSYPDPGYYRPVPHRHILECPAPSLTCASFNLAKAYTPPLHVADLRGWWLQYDKGPTDWMIAYHDWQDEDVDGFIAMMNCGYVGRYAWITINDSPWQYVRVFDCMGRDGDPQSWIDNYIVGEISYGLALKYDVVHKGNVKARIAWE